MSGSNVNPSNSRNDEVQRRRNASANFRSFRPHLQHQRQKPDFNSSYRRDRPATETGCGVPVQQKPRPNFIVELRSESGSSHRKEDVKALIEKCKSTPDDFTLYQTGIISGKLYFVQWYDALEAMVCFWELRFDKVHNLLPNLISNVLVASDLDELEIRLKAVFQERVASYIKGDVVQKWTRKLGNVLDEIAEVSRLLKKFNTLHSYDELTAKKKGLIDERDSMSRRIKEFKSAMTSILGHLEGKILQNCDWDTVGAFKFNGEYNWGRIYHLIMREFRRLENGLPIYAFRHEILNHIYSAQIMVLIGETGSGKSTQLVQYLVDSGFVEDGSIICTQPRKIAAYHWWIELKKK